MLNDLYFESCIKSSDINEHIITLNNIAQKMDSFVEFNGKISTIGIIKGLKPGSKYISICHENPSIIETIAREKNINYKIMESISLQLLPEEIGNVDAMFIDSLHTYVHLTYELEKFHHLVKKTICFHDTSQPWGEINDTSYTGDYSEYPSDIDRNKKGTWNAIIDFTVRHPEWKIKIRYYNNHGFTVLTKETRTYPITFGIPECKIVNQMPEKTNLLAPLIPGDLTTYIYNNEEDYRKQYMDSFFAITTKKEGWDCMRHYEIIACGCIPVFEKIENKPEKTMYSFPVELFQRFNQLYTAAKIFGTDDEDFLVSYSTLWREMMLWFKFNCTNEKIADYVMSKVDLPNCEKILCLPGAWYPDYMAVTVIHGLKMRFGKNCVEFPHLEYLYKDHAIPPQSMYGKGFSYSGTLDKNEYWQPGFENWRSIRELISRHYFDLIVFASSCCGTPFENTVRMFYSDNEIIYINGADESCNENRIVQRGLTFVRELI